MTDVAANQSPSGLLCVGSPIHCLSVPLLQAQGADSGLFVGKTAFDTAVEPVPEPVARPGMAQGSAFSKAAGTGPAFDTLTPKVGFMHPHSLCPRVCPLQRTL